jgi:hypothetical protein
MPRFMAPHGKFCRNMDGVVLDELRGMTIRSVTVPEDSPPGTRFGRIKLTFDSGVAVVLVGGVDANGGFVECLSYPEDGEASGEGTALTEGV